MSGLIHMGKKMARDRRGATAIEYGFLVALIALGLMSAFSMLGDSINAIFGQTGKALVEAQNKAAEAAMISGNGDGNCGTGEGNGGPICEK